MPSFFRNTFLFLSVLVLSFAVVGQGWERTYGTSPAYDEGNSIQQTADGGYIIGGWSLEQPNERIFLIKTDAKGDTIWTKYYGDVIHSGYAINVEQTTDGGYIIGGGWTCDTITCFVHLIKTDANGDTVWTKNLGWQDYYYYYVNSAHQTNDGGYIVGAWAWDSINSYLHLIKLDANGDTTWTRFFNSIHTYYYYSGSAVQQTSDGGYILVGDTCDSTDCYLYLVKTDAAGVIQWSKIIDGADYYYYDGSVQQTIDGGYIIDAWACDTIDCYYSLIKTDANGDTLWTKEYPDTYWSWMGFGLTQTTDSGYVFVGESFDSASSVDVYLIKTDNNGNVLWTNTFGGIGYDMGCSLVQTLDGGYAIVGFTTSFGSSTDGDFYVIKTDGLGNVHSNMIAGRLFYDLNSDCINDSLEDKLSNWLIKVEPGPLYATADSDGYYSVSPLDTGNYTVEEVPINNYWAQTCPNSPTYYSVNFTTFYDTSYFNDFANEISIFCPLLEVDISTWAIRPCMPSPYTVNYCNTGTVDATNVYIEVEFDSVVTPASSTLPWSSQSGNTYIFNIGTVGVTQCGTFYITADVSCSAIIGSTHCIEARIYPDTLCLPVDTAWDKSSVAVEGECVDDSIACFTITNTGDPGTGDMQGPSDYRIYENNILVDSGAFQLAGGDSTVICRPANGNTIRLEADQRPGHPGNSQPQAHVELCGGPPLKLGEIIVVPEDDQDHNIEIDCREITAGIDPNDKQVKPAGLTDNHYIDSTDVLEYHVNFQNTGTDTAFRVVIRDTLTQYLDVITVQSGASSHPYTFKIYGPGILEWTFDNILLPDSTTNELASHGFVKFKVDQVAGNQIGTVIENRVGIIFDFNAPVITNIAKNIVWDMDAVTTSATKIYGSYANILVYPNPFSESFIIEIYDLRSANYDLRIYDLVGREVMKSEIRNQKSEIRRDNLPSGIYIYEISAGVQMIGAGKLIAE
ncbi:MAG: hypothetical protein COA57_06685 [Flavobacteriales bacterium]|nr:MAG: hypothetical protein COA57_06685 [Flavobacteriales bacterium]